MTWGLDISKRWSFEIKPVASAVFNIASLRVVCRKFHSLIFEILVDIQNDIFGDCVVDLLRCCHNETQTPNEARNCFFMIVLGAQMCMHLGVYKN